MYVDFAYIDDIVKNDYDVGDYWVSLSEEKKEKLINKTFNYIEEYGNFIGNKTNIYQDNEFPRDLKEYFQYGDFYRKSHNTIPKEIVKGQIALIIFFLKVRDLPNWQEVKEYDIKKISLADGTGIEFDDNIKFNFPTSVWNNIKYFCVEYFPTIFERSGAEL
jgi:hypothetical protein